MNYDAVTEGTVVTVRDFLEVGGEVRGFAKVELVEYFLRCTI